MKKAIMILIILTSMVYGCSQTNVSVEKNLTRIEAEQLAVKRVYELTKNKDIYNESMPFAQDSWKEGDLWNVIVIASHTSVKTYVYNNGTVKVMPTGIG